MGLTRRAIVLPLLGGLAVLPPLGGLALLGCSSDEGAADGAVDGRVDSTAGRDGADSDARGRDGGPHDGLPTDGAPPRDGPVSDVSMPDVGIDIEGAGSCAKLASDYAKLLDQVKGCNPYTALKQCKLKVPDSLDCPCETYVNDGNYTELKQMLALTNQWTAAGCMAPCPSGPCPVPTSASCDEVGTNTGRCTDQIE